MYQLQKLSFKKASPFKLGASRIVLIAEWSAIYCCHRDMHGLWWPNNYQGFQLYHFHWNMPLGSKGQTIVIPYKIANSSLFQTSVFK